jgi:ribonuclease G
MNKACPTCGGEGVVRSEETIAIDVERRLRKLDSRSEAFLVQVHPRVAAILIGGGGKPLQELEQETRKHFHFHGTEGSALDTFAITAEGTREEIEHRALPFKTGEEVLIRIEEPHMYNVDDAIARIDGYVISIAGGGPFVGEKKLIRIGEVKRTAAYATILTDNGVPEQREARPSAAAGKGRRASSRTALDGAVNEPAPDPDEVVERDRVEAVDAAQDENGERVQSPGSAGKRRHGRRGGRRRSRTRAEKSSAS